MTCLKDLDQGSLNGGPKPRQVQRDIAVRTTAVLLDGWLCKGGGEEAMTRQEEL